MRSYFLTSERLGFSTWSPNDLALASAIWGDPEVMALNGGALAPERVAVRLAHEISNFATLGIQYWPIFRRDDGAHVGCCGLQPRDPAARIFELGYYVRRESWRQGIAPEAARAMVAYAFTTMGAGALFAGHHADNHASRQIILGLGFRYTHDEFYPPSGVDEPCYLLHPAGTSGISERPR